MHKIVDIDLSREQSDAEIRAIHDLWMKYPLLVFRRQRITDAQQIAFARRFGALEIHPAKEHRSSAHPEIYRVANVDEQGNLLPPASAGAKYMSLTRLWHSDSSFREVPSKGSILHGIEVVQGAGQTLFCDLTAVYEALDDATKQRIRGLRVVHSHEHILGFVDGLKEIAGGKYEELPPVTHPLVRKHPVTGRLSLFISPHTMEGIQGMNEKDGRDLLEKLTQFAIQDRFVYRHEWEKDDVIMWDNRCLMHAVMPYDANRVRRIMHRTTIVGDEPVLAA
ncbi:MAG TPA: TauD/TfdA family dioxygenase [Burkholderiales bacterium]|nr:TauD/TfdA family dioxygenase [Burkholderiales bacterium]